VMEQQSTVSQRMELPSFTKLDTQVIVTVRQMLSDGRSSLRAIRVSLLLLCPGIGKVRKRKEGKRTLGIKDMMALSIQMMIQSLTIMEILAQVIMILGVVLVIPFVDPPIQLLSFQPLFVRLVVH
jgi:hypothetical protein